MLHNWPHLYGGSLADVSDLADWKERDQGRFYSQSEAAARDGSRWLALPHCITPALVNYRKSWFAEVGAAEPPKTPTSTGRSVPRSRRRVSPSARRSVTPSTTRRPGPIPHVDFRRRRDGQDREKSGAELEEHHRGGQWMTAFWKEACDEGGLAWDDTTNNRAFHSGEIAATLNGGSIYILARRRPTSRTQRPTALARRRPLPLS